MLAAPTEAPAAAQEVAPISYNWETQNASALQSEDAMRVGAMASSSYLSGVGQTVDDWHLC